MTTLLFLWLVALSVFSAMAAVKLYDDNQRLETRLYMLEHEVDAISDRGMGKND